MNEDTKIFSCEHCDYTSKWKCNTIRHMVRNHTPPKTMITPPKTMITPPKTMITPPKTMNAPPKTMNAPPKTMNAPPKTMNSSAETMNFFAKDMIATNQCELCNKVFSRKYILLKHIDKCKGIINPLQCEYCLKEFNHASNKYVHRKHCKVRIEKELEQNKIDLQNIAVQNITNNNTINNINNTINDNSNTIINQIVVFDPKNMELLNDHITKKDLQNMVINTDFSKILTDYGTALLSRKENQCVRKTNLNSSSSAIHVGDNKWEFHTDKSIYPKLLTRIAYNFSDIKENFKIKVYEQLDTFIDDVASEAEDCHTDEKEEIRLKRLYKKLFNNIKHLIFNLTKKEVDTK